MRPVVASVVSVLLLAVPTASRATGARCNGRGVEETLAQAQEQCCPARSAGQYVSCAAHVCKEAIAAHVLQASCKSLILKHGCDVPTTTTKPPTTTTSTTASTSSSTTIPSTTTSTTAPSTTTSSTTAPPTSTTSTTASTTSTTTQSTTTTSSTASTSTSTTQSTTTSTSIITEPTTSSTTASTSSSTTTTYEGPSSTTTTTLPTPHEICGNCIDDDGNGLTDFEDPACCAEIQTFTMTLSHGRLRPAGTLSRLRLRSLLARTGLSQVNPLQQDVFLQIRPAGGAELLCAKMPASKFMRMHHAFKFWDHKHVVASAKGINDLTVKVRKNGSVRFRTLGKHVQMSMPKRGALQVTVGFHDPSGDAGNRCSSTTQAFRTGRRGALLAP